jgi:hypothetical protein
MRTTRKLEAEWRKVLWRSVGTGAKVDKSSAGLVWAADSVSAFYRGPKKILKIREMNGLQVSRLAPSENGPQHGEIQKPKCA